MIILFAKIIVPVDGNTMMLISLYNDSPVSGFCPAMNIHGIAANKSKDIRRRDT